MNTTTPKSIWRTSFVGVAVLLAAVVLVPIVRAVDPPTWPLLLRSIQLGGAAAAIATPFGAVLAFLLARTRIREHRWLLFATAITLFMPLYLQAASWEAGFGRLGWYTLIREGVAAPWLTGWRAAVWVYALAGAPWATMIYAAGFYYVDAEQEEAAMLEGGWLAAIRGVIGPQTVGATAVSGLWVFLTTAADMTVADLFFIKTYARELYNGFGLGDTLAESWSTAWPGFVLTAILACGAAVCFSWAAPLSAVRSSRAVKRFDLGRWNAPCRVLAHAMVLLLTGAPLVNLGLKAGWVASAEGVRRRGWSVLRMVQSMSDSLWEFRTELGWSLAIGLLAATFAVLSGALLTWLARKGGARAIPLVIVSAFCLAVPGPLIGAFMMWTFNRDLGIWNAVYDRSLFAPVLAVTIRAFPFSAGILWFSFRSLDESLLESGKLDGAGLAAMFIRLAVPLRSGGIAAAWLVAFAVASGDLASTILVAPPGVTTAAVRVFGLIHSGVRHQESGLCLAAIAVYVAVAVGAWFCGRRLLPIQSKS